MIEILDSRDADPEKLDITAELARAAYNVLRQECKQNENCGNCGLHAAALVKCPALFGIPALWPDLEVPDD